jgi:hypothetical protein
VELTCHSSYARGIKRRIKVQAGLGKNEYKERTDNYNTVVKSRTTLTLGNVKIYIISSVFPYLNTLIVFQTSACSCLFDSLTTG